ncbi:hypothetical protein GFK26_18290 [Variovorax paradoxus]|uniref:Uncharacterized protein n=1 Tax=Variovorax paradoxus TaxID=34073 RepID=A0A5Q0M5W6_VARPD|nr:hypothetical protein [Variovorax paradoxus]QFZ84578.1 hypothetical protein GFK26_18290 [Variovorax paradoxus]
MARPSKMQLRLAATPSRGVSGTRPSLIVFDELAARPLTDPLNRPSPGGKDERDMRMRRRIDRAMGYRSSIDDNDDRVAKLDPADKGKQGRNCNVTACQRPNAWFLNSGTDAYYCFDCAWDIRKFNLRRNSDDGFVLFEQWEEDLARFETAMKLNSAAREQYVAERLKS